LLTSGCGKQKPVQSSSVSTPLNNALAQADISNQTASEYELLAAVAVYFDEDCLRSYLDIISGITPDYPYAAFYGVEEAYELSQTNPARATEHGLTPLTNSAQIDSAALYAAVIENNRRFRESNPVAGRFVDDIPNSKLKEYCAIVADAFNALNERYRDNNTDEARCVLENLKVFRDDFHMSMASFGNDGRLSISKSVVDANRLTEEKRSELSHILYHETAHFFQTPCIHNNTSEVGINRRWDALTVNPLALNFYHEAAAEMDASELVSENPISYNQAIKYLRTIEIATILSNQAYMNQHGIINATKDRDLLYQAFGAQTDEERTEVLKLMFTVDSMLYPETHNDFFEAAGLQTSSDDYNSFSAESKPNVFIHLSKCFYSNLALCLADNDDVALEDVFFLISLWECDLNAHLGFGRLGSFDSYPRFISEYVTMQEAFFERLSTACGFSMDELTDEWTRYQIGNSAGLKWLGSDKRDYLFERFEALSAYAAKVSAYTAF